MPVSRWGWLLRSEEEWLDLHTQAEVTLLESGQRLTHHTKANCSGSCCLHGTSIYASCKMPRSWRFDRGIIEHQCEHGVGHPCRAGVEYAKAISGPDDDYDSGIHGCDRCCQSPDKPQEGESPLDRDIEILAEHQGYLEAELGYLDARITKLAWLSLGTVVALGVAFYLITLQ